MVVIAPLARLRTRGAPPVWPRASRRWLSASTTLTTTMTSCQAGPHFGTASFLIKVLLALLLLLSFMLLLVSLLLLLLSFSLHCHYYYYYYYYCFLPEDSRVNSFGGAPIIRTYFSGIHQTPDDQGIVIKLIMAPDPSACSPE